MSRRKPIQDTPAHGATKCDLGKTPRAADRETGAVRPAQGWRSPVALLGAALLMSAAAPAHSREPRVTSQTQPSLAHTAHAEARRLVKQADARRAAPGGAVDLIRLARLARWTPNGWVETHLRKAAKDARRAPLSRAVGWWLVRNLALRRLDRKAALQASFELGLTNRFAVRSGPAPDPTDRLEPGDWSAYPEEIGADTVWLDSCVRPAHESTATLVARVGGFGGPAVLRLGYDDAVTVWLNGDEVYRSPASHTAWLDQAAIPIALRPDDNRLMIEVRQRDGAWRVVARFTDADGEPLRRIRMSADPWGAVPETAKATAPEQVAHLWRALSEAAEREPPDAQAIRDYVDYARRTGLPDEDQAEPRVAIEAVWEADPSPRSLLAWLRILPEAERDAVRAAHWPVRPVERGDVFALTALQIMEGWAHYYAQRYDATLAVLDQAESTAPDVHSASLAVTRLRAVVNDELGLRHSAVARLARTIEAHPKVGGLRHAYINALRSAGRIEEALSALEALRTDGLATADDLYQIATVQAARGHVERAVAVLDHVLEARPELWGYAVEAAEIQLHAGHRADARRRLEALLDRVPRDPYLLERLARLEVEEGRTDVAIGHLRRALDIDARHTDLARYLESLIGAPAPPLLGPPMETLASVPSPPDASAVVLYQHAQSEVAPSGQASRRFRRVVRILDTEGARRMRRWEIPYVPGTQRLEIERAKRHRAGHPPASPARSDRDLSEPEYRLYYELRAEVLTFPQPQPGDVIEVAWRLTDVEADAAFPGYYGELLYLQGSLPRARSIVELVGPQAPDLNVGVMAHGLPIERKGLRFEARDIPGVPHEPGMPGPSSVRAHVHVSSARDWAEIDRRYRKLLDGRDRPNAALADLARRWAGSAVGPAERVRRLHAEVAARTRYVGLELGIHSFKPEEPAVTLARGYGDCKDKATLLIALARAIGLDAHLALVRTRRAGAIGRHPASLAVFDHAVVYVPALDRFLDPTLDRNDPFTLPPSVQGSTAFVVALDQAPRVIPPQDAGTNRSHWRVELTLQADGRLRGDARWTTHGYPATIARRALEAEGMRREVLEQVVVAYFPGARLDGIRVEGMQPALDPVTTDAKITLPRLNRRREGFELRVSGAPWQLVRRYAQPARRRTPLQLEFRARQALTIRIELPRGMSVQPEPPVIVESPFGRLESTVQVGPRSVELQTRLELNAFEVLPEHYSAFREWLDAVDHVLARKVEIRKGRT